MGLETGTYISDLIVTNPEGIDNKSQGDDHIRLIKAVLKATFPNLTGPVTLTQSEINSLTGSGNDTYVATGQFIPSGVIMMWKGALASIPAGYSLCDGTGGTPNLEDKFIVGKVADVGGLGNTGGSNLDHTHTATIAGHAITEAEMSSHTHTMFTDEDSSAGEIDQSSDYAANVGGLGNNGSYIIQGVTNPPSVGRTKATGNGVAHTHTASLSSTSHLPAYYQLAFIMKD